MKTESAAYRSTIRVLLATALLLSIPLMAKLFTDEMAWDLFDFAFMGALIAGTGLTYETAKRMSSDVMYRLAVGSALAGVFLLVWINLAVGIIGSEDDPANGMYFWVLAVAFFGTIVARFQPQAMARVMSATALAQALVAVIALVLGLGAPESGPMEIVGANGIFIAFFVASAALFREAARGDRDGARHDPRPHADETFSTPGRGER